MTGKSRRRETLAHDSRWDSLAFAMESRISPQRAAKKSNAIEYDLFVIQHMDISWRLADEIVGKANVMTVVLVIARHVDHGGHWKLVSRPLDTAQAHTYVAGEAVFVEVIVSALVFAWKSAKHVRLMPQDIGPGVRVYSLQGVLYFGSVREFSERLSPGNDPHYSVARV